MTYTIAQEPLETNYVELEPLFREHYAEMSARLAGLGQICSPYCPRLAEYFKAAAAGHLLTFIARHDGTAVGYLNVYLTGDMHNGDLIAQEDTLFVTKAHRHGLGKRLVITGLDALRMRGVRRLNVTAMTDLRVEKLWRRMGFVPVATQMVYNFGEAHV